MHKAINFILFQLGWFGIAFSADAQLPWIATGIAGAVLAVHLSFAARPCVEWKLALSAGLLGLLLDSLLTAAGLLKFSSGQWADWIAPHWIAALWMMFATLLNSSLSWLKGHYGLAAALGAIAGPLAYLGGAELGALVLTQPPLASLTGVAVAWLVAMPTLVFFTRTWDGVTPMLEHGP